MNFFYQGPEERCSWRTRLEKKLFKISALIHIPYKSFHIEYFSEFVRQRTTPEGCIFIFLLFPHELFRICTAARRAPEGCIPHVCVCARERVTSVSEREKKRNLCMRPSLRDMLAIVGLFCLYSRSPLAPSAGAGSGTNRLPLYTLNPKP